MTTLEVGEAQPLPVLTCTEEKVAQHAIPLIKRT